MLFNLFNFEYLIIFKNFEHNLFSIDLFTNPTSNWISCQSTLWVSADNTTRFSQVWFRPLACSCTLTNTWFGPEIQERGVYKSSGHSPTTIKVDVQEEEIALHIYNQAYYYASEYKKSVHAKRFLNSWYFGGYGPGYGMLFRLFSAILRYS